MPQRSSLFIAAVALVVLAVALGSAALTMLVIAAASPQPVPETGSFEAHYIPRIAGSVLCQLGFAASLVSIALPRRSPAAPIVNYAAYPRSAWIASPRFYFWLLLPLAAAALLLPVLVGEVVSLSKVNGPLTGSTEFVGLGGSLGLLSLLLNTTGMMLWMRWASLSARETPMADSRVAAPAAEG